MGEKNRLETWDFENEIKPDLCEIIQNMITSKLTGSPLA